MATSHARWVATTAAVASASVYLLIGFELVSIGEPASGESDILAFGLSAGAAFVFIAFVVWFTRRRWVLGLVGLFDALVLVAYFAFAGLREPLFEPWGLLIKVCQAVLLGAVAVVLVREPKARTSVPATMPGIGGVS
jgi:hypothetical protein